MNAVDSKVRVLRRLRLSQQLFLEATKRVCWVLNSFFFNDRREEVFSN